MLGMASATAAWLQLLSLILHDHQQRRKRTQVSPRGVVPRQALARQQRLNGMAAALFNTLVVGSLAELTGRRNPA